MTYRYPGGLVRRTAANTSITGASGVWDLGSQAQAVKTNTWPISGLANPISGSLRFRNSASAYLSRTPTVASGENQWTFSTWVKRGFLTSEQFIIGGNTTTSGGVRNQLLVLFNSDHNLWVNAFTNASGYYFQRVSNAVYRDTSAWYHLVVQFDPDNGTSANRIIAYINGQQVSWGTSSDSGAAGSISSSAYRSINNTYRNDINGGYQGGGAPIYFGDGYQTEINMVSGSLVSVSSFGQTSPITGVWEPIKYTGTYGTNGFYLSLSDTSSIGKDFSGNGNNWTPNNISTASGSTFDLMRDVPTQWAPQGVTDVGGTVRGNYCTWNPLNKSSNHNSTNGNLTASSSGGTSYGAICGTMGVSSGKWYWEMTYTRNGSTNSPVIGFGNDLFRYTNPPDGYLGSDLNAGGINVINGNAAINATSTAYGSAIATNDVVMFAMDLDNRKFYIGKNGTWFNSGNPVAGTNQWPYSATIVGSTFFPAVNMFNDTGDANFGQRPFAYTVPTGFKSLCTTNLPTPTIGATVATAANKYFDATLYTGNGGTQTITNAGGFQPDFIWEKARSDAFSHMLYNSLSGVGKYLRTNLTSAEVTDATTLTSFNSNGFTVGAGDNGNNSGSTAVAWQWNAGGSTVTNTSGSISSQVRANPTAGFSIATWTGQTSGSATIGHGLGVAPSVVLVKGRNDPGQWWMYHSAMGNTKYIWLNNTSGSQTGSGTNAFADTAPTSTVFTVGTSFASSSPIVNWVAYCFAPIAGYSAFGSYTGNGSSDGPFVYLGFRPKWIMIKRSDATTDWTLLDTARDTYNGMLKILYPDSSSNEDASSIRLDSVSNGFKIRISSASQNYNTSSGTYIYMAFAEHPFKNALAR